MSAPNNEMIEIKTDSLKNCLASDCLAAPITLRTPISLDRLMERAVARFIKFTHAISKTNNAIRLNAFMWLIFPPEGLPLSKLARRCQSVNGNKNISTLSPHRGHILGCVIFFEIFSFRAAAFVSS